MHACAVLLAEGLRRNGYQVGPEPSSIPSAFASIRTRRKVLARAAEQHINLRCHDDQSLGLSLDERTTLQIETLLSILGGPVDKPVNVEELAQKIDSGYSPALARTSGYLTHPVFNRYHSEHEMFRYIHRLQARDLSLVHSMIPLGSCTMKLNATAEMLPVTWPEFAGLHPFAPTDQTDGYRELFRQLEQWLAEITGFTAISLQPNAGSQGEYAGLLVIRAYHCHRGESHRDVCLIPVSAHGTNPASAAMAGIVGGRRRVRYLRQCGSEGFRSQSVRASRSLAAIMITYPSTHGVFEEGIRRDMPDRPRSWRTGVYGRCESERASWSADPADIGADVCHLNLHKTFCIPHGGGGPGMGPIGVARHLSPFLPGHPVVNVGGSDAIGAVSAAPYGSPSILTIP